jgi:hypothetical protein
MTASMLDELQQPPPPKIYICPCCFLTFTYRSAFITHCEKMKVQIDAAIAGARAWKK